MRISTGLLSAMLAGAVGFAGSPRPARSADWLELLGISPAGAKSRLVISVEAVYPARSPKSWPIQWPHRSSSKSTASRRCGTCVRDATTTGRTRSMSPSRKTPMQTWRKFMVQNRVALALPVLPDVVTTTRHHGQEEIAGRDPDRDPAFAGWQPEHPRPEQRGYRPAQGRVGPLARYRRCNVHRLRRLRRAGQARCGEDGRPQSHGGRRGRRAPAAERAGGGRADRPAGNAARQGVPDHDHRACASPTPSSSGRSC